MNTRHRNSGDEPITVRTLVQIAENMEWALDTPLSVIDLETDEKLFARAVSIVPGRFGDEDWSIDFDFLHEDEWVHADYFVEKLATIVGSEEN